MRITVDPDDPQPKAIAGYLAEVARRLDERPERMSIVIDASNAERRAVSLDFTPQGEMVVSVEGRRPRKLDLRRRWIPEHPVPLVLWSRRQRRKVRLYVDPVDANRFRVMSALPRRVPLAFYVGCSLLAAAGALQASPACIAAAAALAACLALCPHLPFCNSMPDVKRERNEE